MRKKNRYNALFIVLGLAAACVVTGLIATPTPPAQPVKLLMPNAGGRVIFNHRQHAEDYGVVCSVCHHVEMASTVWNRDTHDLHTENFVESCQDCHHDSSLEAEPMSCYSQGCHARLLPGERVDEKPQNIPARDAVHQRCAACHAHAYIFDEGLAGCASCHEFAPPPDDRATYSLCADCHTQPPLAQTLPDRMTIYHKQCGDCHNAMSGPLVEQDANQCYQCHVR